MTVYGFTKNPSPFQFKKALVIIILCLTFGNTSPAQALKLRSTRLKIPDHAFLTLSTGYARLQGDSGNNYRAYFPASKTNAVTLTVRDPFGVAKEFSLPALAETNYLEIESGIITAGLANPQTLDVLPKLCPRLAREKSDDLLVYDARNDLLNGKPSVQLLDPDAVLNARQRALFTGIDDRNVLRIVRAKISYDYEDSGILDYEGKDPLTGTPDHRVFEGEGGFYANFHYAVMPFDARYLNLSRQEMLHLIQGKLADINRNDLAPDLRAHAFLPGPYLSKNAAYALCEWGDTAHQAKNQELHYENLKIWDWDLETNNNGLVMLVVWEGDEEEWMQDAGLIPKHHLTDDLVGIFVVNRETTINKELTLRNDAGDFEIAVITNPSEPLRLP